MVSRETAVLGSGPPARPHWIDADLRRCLSFQGVRGQNQLWGHAVSQ